MSSWRFKLLAPYYIAVWPLSITIVATVEYTGKTTCGRGFGTPFGRGDTATDGVSARACGPRRARSAAPARCSRLQSHRLFHDNIQSTLLLIRQHSIHGNSATNSSSNSNSNSMEIVNYAINSTEFGNSTTNSSSNSIEIVNYAINSTEFRNSATNSSWDSSEIVI